MDARRTEFFLSSMFDAVGVIGETALAEVALAGCEEEVEDGMMLLDETLVTET